MVVRKLFELTEHVDIELRTSFRNFLKKRDFLEMVQQVFIHRQSVTPNADTVVLMESNAASADILLGSILALDLPHRQCNPLATWKFLLTPARSL